MRTAMLGLQRQYPALPMVGVGMDFSGGLELPPQVGPGRRLWFYPGSSIGNFSPGASLELLRQVRAGAQGGGLLIGVDLVKPLSVLEAAYDDDLGVTAAFNRNLLLHVNRLLGTDFDIRQWCHRAFFNVTQSRIEMHLQATQDLVVHWPGASRAFAQGEGIHTENSYKYTSDGFEALLRQAGFGTVQRWSDSGEWFALFWAAN